MGKVKQCDKSHYLSAHGVEFKKRRSWCSLIATKGLAAGSRSGGTCFSAVAASLSKQKAGFIKNVSGSYHLTEIQFTIAVFRTSFLTRRL